MVLDSGAAITVIGHLSEGAKQQRIQGVNGVTRPVQIREKQAVVTELWRGECNMVVNSQEAILGICVLVERRLVVDLVNMMLWGTKKGGVIPMTAAIGSIKSVWEVTVQNEKDTCWVPQHTCGYPN